jgi:hypothetical protein
MFGQSSLAFTDIKVAWGTDFGSEGGATARRKKLRDPICDAYTSQFKKVNETLANSALPNPPEAYPYKDDSAALDRFVDAAQQQQQQQQPTTAPRYDEDEEEDAPPPQVVAPPTPTYAPRPERSLRTQLLELLLYAVSGGILIVVLDIAVRLGMLLERRRRGGVSALGP